MLYFHLSLSYRNGGLGALVRQGADCDQILAILRDARHDAGVTKEEEDEAYEAFCNAEKSRHGRLMQISHEKYQAALDTCLFSAKSNLVFTPRTAYFRGGDDVLEVLKDSFACVAEHDEIWRIEGKRDEIRKKFLELTK